MKRKNIVASCLLFALANTVTCYGQLTLSGECLVDGDLTVGTATNQSSMVVNGRDGDFYGNLVVYGGGAVVFRQDPLPQWGGAFAVDSDPSKYRLYWNSSKGIFSAGKGNIMGEDVWRFGEYSASFGSSIAQGKGSFAAGDNSIAAGDGSIALLGGITGPDGPSLAIGGYSLAGVALPGGRSEGTNAIAGGVNAFARGNNSVAFSGTAYGDQAIAISNGVAFGERAFASMGGVASETDSVAFGGVANGRSSVAFMGAIADGESSFATGNNSFSASFGSFVVGQFNVPDYDNAQDRLQWQSGDELFVIGNGTGKPSDPPEVQYRNAMVVYKSGDIKIPKRQGDILMGEFGNPE